MPRLSVFLVPLTLFCWLYARKLYQNSVSKFYSNFDSCSDGLPPPHQISQTQDGPIPGDQPNNIFYFVQISDLHISRYKPKYGNHFRYFLNSTLKYVDPRFVLVTGDLTDAKDENKMRSLQVREEWVEYHTALAENGILEKENFWFDQRGNHDCFNVPGWDSRVNYFKELSVIKDDKYSFHLEESFGKYSFIALDACPVFGPARPFNFFGYFDRKDMDFLQLRLLANHDSNHTFILSHYMVLTAYTTKGYSFKDLSQYISVFLCGHLHKLAGGIGEIMHVHHPENFLELELADMKSHGSFRIMAVDHDLISFVDSSILSSSSSINHNSKPIVLITNPKDSRYFLNGKEPSYRILKSTHIRVLIFSPFEIQAVNVFIDNFPHIGSIKRTANSKIPLWVIEWNPEEYNDSEKHILRVEAKDENGIVGYQIVIFRTDGKLEPLNIGFGEYIISPRYETLFQSLFFLGYSLTSICLLLIPKLFSFYLHKTKRYHRWRVAYSAYLIKLDEPVPKRLISPTSFVNILKRAVQVGYWRCREVQRDFVYFIHSSAFRFVTLASLPSTFYPLYLYSLYFLVGPIFIGELIPASDLHPELSSFEQFGWFYLYGVYVEHDWIPITDTWLYGLFEMAYLLTPLVIYLSFCITPPEQLYAPKSRKSETDSRDVFYFPSTHNRRKYPLHRRIYVRIIVAIAVLYQLINVFFIGIYYGKWAMILSPGKTWFVIWGIYALYKHRWSSVGHEVDLHNE